MKEALKRLARSLVNRCHLLAPFVNRPTLDQTASTERVLAGGTSYEAWMRQELVTRAARYRYTPEAGLLSLITPVWNSPPQFLSALAESVFGQQTTQPFEWVVVDNGSQSAETREYLERIIRQDPRVTYMRIEENMGIAGGMRTAVAQASGRYIVPVDHDDFLYPDCISIVTSIIQRHNYPSLLYSDEDLVCGNHTVAPYSKPDWDPVLFLNSAYIAHLGVIDRCLGKRLGIYSDPEAEGSPDWDAFTRFVVAGHTPVHIPEMLYSWRIHPDSTAGDIASKDYIYTSQRKVLDRYLDSVPGRDLFSVELSPLFKGTPDWRFKRKEYDPSPLAVVVLGGSTRPDHRHDVLDSFEWPGHVAVGFPLHRSLHDMARVVSRHAARDGLVAFVSDRVVIQDREWAWQALGLMELHPDVVLVGGRISRDDGVVLDAGRYFGFGRGCDCPDRGRHGSDLGYHGQMFKERSVDAVPIQFCVFQAKFLLDLLADGHVRKHATLCTLHLWAGTAARRQGARVVYSPFLTAKTSEDWLLRISEEDQRDFVRHNADVICEAKYYSMHLDVSGGRPYQETTAQARHDHLAGQLMLCGLDPEAAVQREFCEPTLLASSRVA